MKVVQGQTSELMERFTVKGRAKLVAAWPGKTPKEVSGTLTSGDKLAIYTRQMEIYVTSIHNKVGKQLVVTGTDESLDSIIIEVYEYDFDNDGQKEIIIIYSPEFSITTVEIFKYSGGLAERVGNFDAQFEIHLDKNTISLPYGSQGLAKEYLYKSGGFFQLVYHDANNKDE